MMGFAKKISLFVAVSQLLACGSSDFNGEPKTRLGKTLDHHDASAPPDDDFSTDFPRPNPSPQPLEPVTHAVHWNLICDGGASSESPLGTTIVSGPGDHILGIGHQDIAQVELRGMPCNKSNKPRDILFIIDVSGSMENNDPKESQSCGRMDAVRAVLDQAEGSDTQFGLLTFSRNARTISSGYFATQNELFADLMIVADEDDVAEIVCDSGGGTDYRDALIAAQNLIADSSRSTAQVEIFMISDGDPDLGKSGTSIAQDLKDQGTIIGTVMLEGDDEVLEQSIASRDAAGNPYHVMVNNSADLADVLQILAASFGATSGHIRYRFAPTDVWTSVVINSQSLFSTGKIPLSLQTTPTGLELEYEFFDPQLDSKIVQSGKLILDSD